MANGSGQPQIATQLHTHMKQEHQDLFCEEVRRLWMSLESRPWGVWIREHEPVEAPGYDLTTSVLAAWFLDSGTLSVRTPSEFVRFYRMQGTRPWHSGFQPPPAGLFRTGTHEIGLAGFALVADSDEVYFEWQFGGTFGRGSTYTIDDEGRLQMARPVYVS